MILINNLWLCPYLPTWFCMSVITEILCDPTVDLGERNFGLLAGLHRHTDERCVGVRRLYVTVRLVVDLLRRVHVSCYVVMRIRSHLWMCVTVCGGRVTARCSGSLRHPRGRGVSGGRAGGRVGAPQRQVFVAVDVRRVTAGAGTFLGVCAQNRKILKPVQTSQTIIQGHGTVDVIPVVWMEQHPFLFKLRGDIRTYQHGHLERKKASIFRVL